MLYRIIALGSAAVLMLVSSVAYSLDLTEIQNAEREMIIRGDEKSDLPYYPTAPGLITNSPGEIVGTTYLAYQTNGSTGNRIAIDSLGRIHIAWTKGVTPGGHPRYVYYNFRDENGQWLGETQISSLNGSGFVTLDLLPGNRPILAYNSPVDTSTSIVMAKDDGEYPVENSMPYSGPHIAQDYDSRIHMVCDSLGSGNIGYAYSEDDGETWSGIIPIAQHDILSATICSSPVSPRSAIVYTALVEPVVQVFFVEAEDGLSWDFRFPINITEFTPMDSCSAWTDVDCIYDYDDELHISYQKQEARGDTIFPWGDLMHWNWMTGHSVIATHPNTDTCAIINYCACICKMSLGVTSYRNDIVVLWSELSQSDVSAGGYSNGELYAALSSDNGENWGPAVNLTNSPTPGCVPPDCDSDVWSSMAEVVDDSLHIMYIDDNDAGAEWNGEGQWTLNNVLYLEIDVGELYPVDAYDQNSSMPAEFSLSQNYPNPFNAQTTIEFQLDAPSRVHLQAYDIMGASVAVLVDDYLEAGTYSAIWDCGDFASGIYYYRLKTDSGAQVKRMTLIK